MKYVILIRSHPDPWGHPTTHHTAEGRALEPEQREASDREFDALLSEISASGELVGAEALADPNSATLHSWGPQGHRTTGGPYAEAEEQVAGLFVVDCETRERAEAIAAQFAAPGEVIELRPVMSPGADDR